MTSQQTYTAPDLAAAEIETAKLAGLERTSPKLLTAFARFDAAAMAEGALPRKTKELIAVAGALLRPRVRWDTSDGLFDEPVEVTRWTTLRAERSRARRSKHLRLWAGSGG